MGRARGANAKLAGAFETTYGVPPGTGYRGFPFVSSNLGAEEPLEESDLLGNGRETYDPTKGPVTNDGDVVVPVDIRYFGHWLKLLLGAPASTGGSGNPYVHVYTSGKVALPSMAIETQFPDRPSYATSYGVKANTLQIQMQRSGQLSATIGLIAKGETDPVAASTAGVLAAVMAMDRFAQARGQIKRQGVKIGSIVSATIGFTNNLDKIDTIQPDGEIEDADGGTARGTGSLTARYDNDTLRLDASNGEPVELSFEWALGEGYSLVLSFGRVFLPKVKHPITGPGGVQATYNWQASGQDGPALVATLTNDVEDYA